MVAPLVALHGFGGTAEDWTPTLERLDRRRLRMLPCLPGHSGQPPPVDFEEAVTRLATLLPAEPVILLGYSMGGRLALGLLHRAPRRLAAVVVVAGHLGLEEDRQKMDRVSLDAARAQHLSEDPQGFWKSWDALPLLACCDQAAAEESRMRRKRHPPIPLAETMSALSTGNMPNFRPMLRRPSRPVLLVAGDRDPFYREMYEGLSPTAATVRVVGGAGHRILIDAPDRLAQVAETWTSSVL